METTQSILKRSIIQVSLENSRFGNLQPTLTLMAPTGTSYRLTNAAIHTLAAMAECQTPHGEGWVVNVTYDGISLELMKCTPEEVQRGMTLLNNLKDLL